MIKTLEMLAFQIQNETGLGHPPIMIDGQTRLQLMNLDHDAFCFHNLGYGNEQWLVWRNPKMQFSVPTHQIEPNGTKIPIPSAQGLDPAVSVPEKEKSMFDGLWWSREADKFFEVIGDLAYTIDENGYRDCGKYNIVAETGFILHINVYIDERHCSTRTHPQGSTKPWPELKGRFKNTDPGDNAVGKL